MNTKHWFEPNDFDHNLPLPFVEVCCDYLNRLRIEYISLRWNGMPLKSYKEEVKDKINAKKDKRLASKLRKAEIFMDFLGMKLKDDFDPLEENSKPKRKDNENDNSNPT